MMTREMQKKTKMIVMTKIKALEKDAVLLTML